MKIVCIVQARMGSERLPGKVMKKILGQPMITYTLDRIRKSKYVNEVVLATSTECSEEPMVAYLEENQYNIFRGNEKNVLERYVEASKAYNADIIIRVTGDCPLIDVILLDQVIEYYLTHSYDYVALNVPNTMIRGFDVEIFSRENLNKVYEKVNKIQGDSPYKEHVTLYMYRHEEEFSVRKIDGTTLYQKPYRLCVDTEEDFKVVEHIYEYFQDKYVTAEKVITYLDTHPEIVQINKEINQKHV
ncbi:MAG: glycosyltransferase family protein [Cellulosilyticum sp.]|nr:glycosyltransferase family protein [Cellulosilyticum sp.]